MKETSISTDVNDVTSRGTAPRHRFEAGAVDWDHDISRRMSLRLITVADMLGDIRNDFAPSQTKDHTSPPCRYKRVADVGCDHGYVSIYLVQKGIAESAIAMDIRKGPLSMAESNIAEYGLSDRIEVCLSDGLSELRPGEADSLIIAGMGGKLMISILEAASLKSLGIKTMILQPQSDLEEFRSYLISKNYITEDEQIIYDEGKYYFPMRVSVTDGSMGANPDARSALNTFMPEDTALRLHLKYGTHNILRKDRVLKNYLLHGREVTNSVLSNLNKDTHTERYLQLKTELDDIDYLLDYL